jgi:hypothetical protein
MSRQQEEVKRLPGFAIRGSATLPPWASDLSVSVVQRISERGARMARRDDRGYREYLREEQRSQPGCPARKALYK